MKVRDVLAFAFIVFLAVGGKLFGGFDPDDSPPSRRPDPHHFAPPSPIGETRIPDRRRTEEPDGNALPGESPFDRNVIVEVGDRALPSTGTAFSVNRNGIWITARHVTDGCRTVAIRSGRGKLVRTSRVRVVRHADISLLWTRGGAPAMTVIRPDLRVGEDGYSFGYPGGRPGDVHARLIGRRNMLSRGRYRTDEPVIAWTQVSRKPDRGADLSGISGGPWVDANGDVIGVHVAGAPRRGRSYSTAPRSLLQAIEESGIVPQPDPSYLPARTDLSPRRYGRYGDELRRQLTIAKVVCLTN